MTMITRSMTNATSPKTIHRKPIYKPKYNVCIDFDSASLAWRANKKHVGNGEFVYVPVKDRRDIENENSSRWQGAAVPCSLLTTNGKGETGSVCQRTRKVPQRYSS